MKNLYSLLLALLVSTVAMANDRAKVVKHAQHDFIGTIHERPEGDVHHYTRSGQAWTVTASFLVTEASQDGLFMEVVFSPDGKKAYLKDPVSTQQYDTYVEGNLSADGKTISVPFGQVIAHYSAYGLDVLFGYVEMQGYENHLTGIAVEDEDVVYTISDNGVISLQNSSYYKPAGAIYGDDYTWLGYGDCYSRYTPTNATPIGAPEGLTTETYRIEYDNLATLEREGHVVEVGFDGNDVYMRGVSTTYPDGWLRGTLDGSTVTVLPQYSGNTEKSTIFFLPGQPVVPSEEAAGTYDPTSLWEKTDAITFTYDAAAKTFTSDGALYVATSMTTPYYLEAYVRPSIAPFSDRGAVPCDPIFVSYADPYLNQFGYFDVKFDLSPNDTEGNPLDLNKLFYRIYLDDEQMTFYTDDYSQFPRYGYGDLEELPYSFTEGFDIMGPGYLSIYAHGVDRVGCQLVYYGGTETTFSNITNYDVATKQVDTIVVGLVTVLSEPTTLPSFDLSGRRAAAGSRGIVITNGKKTIR